MMLRTYLFAWLGLALLGPAALEAQMPSTKVVAAEAELRDAPTTVTLVATIEPSRRSIVAAELSGIVAEMPARQGDSVLPPGVICRLNADTLLLRIQEEQAALNALKAKHEELLAGTRPKEIERLKALLDEVTADYERWEFEKDRISRLYEESDANKKEYTDTLADFQTAGRRKIAAQATYDLAVEGPRTEEIARAAYEVAAQQAVVDRLKSDLKKMTIQAPFAGHVAQRLTEIGEWVPVGGAVVELVDLSRVLVVVHVPEAALPYVKVDQQARVRVDALGRSFEGKIRHIVRQADVEARTFPVEIEVENGEGLLAAGMFARATIVAGPAAPIVAVPKDAVVEREGSTYVCMVMPGQEGGSVGIRLPVTIGSDLGDWISITSDNVGPGMSVIIRGNESIMPFPTPVILVDEKGTPIASPQIDGGPRPPGTPSHRGGAPGAQPSAHGHRSEGGSRPGEGED
ncbi:MAG: efflux RND transporter periplasmic adaptor subunit [Phycisphaerales bacterium]|nr:MAG: efflux RND transporter periplasmic adaptor subunit [Phycisphaerales bacterium]